MVILSITPNGTGDIVLDGQNWPQADGSANQYLKTDGSGQLSWAAIPSGSFTISDNAGTPNTDTFTTGNTLTFQGSTGITTTVSNDNVAIAITAGGVDTTQLAADAVTGAKVADDAIDSEHIADGAIDTAHIADDQVTNAKLANITRGSIKVGGTSDAPTDLNAKTSGYILVGDGTDVNSVAVSGDVTLSSAGAVTIASGAVETGMIAADAVTGAKIADDAIDSEHITDGSVDNVHLAGSIANSKLANSSVTVGSTSISLGSTATTVDGLNTVHGIDGSGTDAAGTDLTIKAGGGTGTGAGGEILFQVADGEALQVQALTHLQRHLQSQTMVTLLQHRTSQFQVT